MITRKSKDGWVLFTQYAHSLLSGDIMKSWGNQEFMGISSDSQLMYAVANHDKGWQDWDSNPRINPDNDHPASFIDMYTQEQHVIWSKCFENLPDAYSYSSALIALHFSNFNNHILSQNPENEEVINFKNKIDNLVSGILNIDINDVDNNLPADVLRKVKFIQTGDIISLALCNGWDSITVRDVPIDENGNKTDLTLNSNDGLNYTINPQPFSLSYNEFNITGLEITGEKFGSDAELREAIKNGKTVNYSFCINQQC